MLIHANECLWPDTPLIAKAEILRFSREGAAGDYELIQAAAMNRPPHDDCSVNCERGPDDAGPHAISYFDLPQAGEVYRRFVSNKNGEGFYSEWRRCAVP